MKPTEFLSEAEYIAAIHPEDELSVEFLEAITHAETNVEACINLASKLILKYYSEHGSN